MLDEHRSIDRSIGRIGIPAIKNRGGAKLISRTENGERRRFFRPMSGAALDSIYRIGSSRRLVASRGGVRRPVWTFADPLILGRDLQARDALARDAPMRHNAHGALGALLRLCSSTNNDRTCARDDTRSSSELRALVDCFSSLRRSIQRVRVGAFVSLESESNSNTNSNSGRDAGSPESSVEYRFGCRLLYSGTLRFHQDLFVGHVGRNVATWACGKTVTR